MAESRLEQTGEQIAATARKASRAASAVADALEDGVGVARRVAKQGGDAAEELLDDTKKRLQRHPIETVVVTFVVGVTAGIVIGWMMKRR
jgi:ElaB/YqjD/DUF883 family membrane-anchored ribosome-binding protein